MKQLWLWIALCVGCGGGAGDTPPDDAPGQPAPDAAVADAPGAIDASPDAPPVVIDAAPDGPPAEAVTVALAAPPVFTSHGPDRTVFATATNHTAAELALTVTATGDVTPVADGACDHVAAGASCAITLRADTTTLGARAGTLTVTGGGAAATTAVAAQVDAFVGATVVQGSGTVTFDPAPETGCVGGGCYPLGTPVVMTHTPGPALVLQSWGIASCFAHRCAVVAAATPIEAAITYIPAVEVHVEIVGGPGQVSVGTTTNIFEDCEATCTVMVDATLPVDVYITSAVELTRIDGDDLGGPFAAAGAERHFPAGARSILVEFSPKPGEVDLIGDDVAFDRTNRMAIAAPGPGGVETVTVYDAAMAVQWSVPGRRVAFTHDGELYVERLDPTGPVTTKYDVAGHPIATAAIALGVVTPDGGMLHPGPASNNITRRDPTLTAVAVLTLSAPYAGDRGCLAMTDTSITATVSHASDGEMSLDVFAVDGTFVRTAGTIWFTCHTAPDWDAGVVTSAFHPDERTASHGSFFVDDLTGYQDDQPYGASVDLAGNLYWMGTSHSAPGHPLGGVIRKYTPPSDVPVATIERLTANVKFDEVGITPIKVVSAPDGRVAWVVTWFQAFGLGPHVVEIFAP